MWALLKHALFWPVTGPTFLARFSIEKIYETVRQELTDDARVKEELLALQLEWELGQIDEAEYARREAALLARLREVQRWREEFGMATRGGPVRVQEAPVVAEGGAATVELAWGDADDEATGRAR